MRPASRARTLLAGVVDCRRPSLYLAVCNQQRRWPPQPDCFFHPQNHPTDALPSPHTPAVPIRPITTPQQQHTKRFDVPNHRLRAWNEGVQRQLLQRPAEYLPGFQDAIRDHVRGLDGVRAALTPDTEVLVGVSGEFGDLELSPRELSSGHLGRLVKVYGIVTKCSLVRPKLVKSVHYCPDTKVSLAREYRDVTALVGLPTGASYPTRDAEGHLLVTEYGRCRYRDNQMVTMQELPETAPPGQLPHSGACFGQFAFLGGLPCLFLPRVATQNSTKSKRRSCINTIKQNTIKQNTNQLKHQSNTKQH